MKYRSKGMGSVYKRGKTFYLQYMVNGKLKKLSLKTTSKREADKKAKELLSPVQAADTKEKIAIQVAEARNLLPKNKLKLNDVWNVYIENPSRPDSGESTLLFYKRNWNRFLKWLNLEHSSISDFSHITSNEAQEYAQYLWELGISAKTYNEHIRTLGLITRILFSYAGVEGNVWKNIAKKNEEKQSRSEFSENEVLKIINSFEDPELLIQSKDEMEVLFNFGIWTGLRLIDCVLMKWESINISRNIITCKPQKTSRKTNRLVSIPIHPLLKIRLDNALTWKENDYVLPNVAERYLSNSSGVKKDIQKIIKFNDFVTNKKIEGVQRKLKANIYGFHSFRHSFVSFCAKAGVPLPVVQAIVGHGNPAITRHYIHIGEESVRQAIDALPQGNLLTESKRTLDEKVKEVTDLLNSKPQLTETEMEIFKILQ
jgi:integrase